MSKLILIDVSGIIHRVYHSLNVNKFRRSSDNLPTNAIFGFIKIILNLNKNFKNYKMIACMDTKKENLWRTTVNSEYKANRNKTANELACQFKYIEEAIESMNMTKYKIDTFEADDVISSLCYQNQDKEEIIVASSDKDMIQLLEYNNVKIYNPQKKEYITTKECQEKYGIEPNQFTFYQTLIGDSTDNISGIKGVGPKTATKIVNNYKTFENFCKDENNKYKDHIENCKKDNILVTLSKDIKFDTNEFKNQDVNSIEFEEFCKKMEFSSIKFKKRV